MAGVHKIITVLKNGLMH